MPSFTAAICCMVLEFQSEQLARNKRHPDRNKKVKLYLFTDIYFAEKSLKNPFKKLLEQKYEFIKAVGQNNTQKSVVFLVIAMNNQKMEIPFTTAFNKMKYPGTNFAQEVKDM